MSKLIDLSLRIENGMQIHPDDAEVRIMQDKFIKTDKYVNHILRAGMHSGTHIDTPMHGIESDTYVSEIPLSKFMGRGYIIDAKDQEVVTFKNEYFEEIKEDDIVLIYTGHIKKYGQSEYYSNHPVIDDELAQFLVDKKVKMVGIDAPSIDKVPHELHKLLFKNDIFIIENLSNLDELLFVEDFEIMAFPLKILAEASMVRVVAKLL